MKRKRKRFRFVQLLWFSNRINMVIFPKLNYRIQTALLVLFMICFVYSTYNIIPIIQEVDNKYRYFSLGLLGLIFILILWLIKPHSTDSLYKKSELP